MALTRLEISEEQCSKIPSIISEENMINFHGSTGKKKGTVCLENYLVSTINRYLNLLFCKMIVVIVLNLFMDLVSLILN